MVNFKIMVYSYKNVAFIKLDLVLIIICFIVIFKSTSSISSFTTLIGLLLSVAAQSIQNILGKRYGRSERVPDYILVIIFDSRLIIIVIFNLFITSAGK